jgi:Tfp pilus assembly PilM family ATPase
MSIFSKITNPNFPRTAIGLEKNRVTVVGLRKDGRLFAIKQAATVEMPDNVLQPGFSEPNILDFEMLAGYLTEAVEAADLRSNKRWSVSLPSASARTGIVTLDAKPASKSELEEVLNWKAERSFGATMSEMRVSWLSLLPDETGKARYFATAVRYNVLDEYESLFNALGWQVGMILPRPVAETRWLSNIGKTLDSLLISSQTDGFNAVLMHRGEPGVVRSITCTEEERDDEIYRLLMFYRDRLAKEQPGNLLSKLLVIGKDFNLNKLNQIGEETLGQAPAILRPDEVGLELPVGTHISFEEVAAPAGLASLSWA